MTNPLIPIESERALVGAMLVGVSVGIRDATDPLFRDVDPSELGDPTLRVIWRAMTDLASEDIDPSPAAVTSRLTDYGEPKHGALIGKLMASDEAALPSYHVGIIRDRSARRRILHAVRTVEEKATTTDTPLSELLDTTERTVLGATMAKNTAPMTPQPVGRLMMGVVDLIESGGYKGTPTGFADLDAMLTGGGILPGQLVVVAGATAMGKSAFATGVAAHMAISEKRPVAYCSIEMTARDNALRLLCHESRTDLKAVSEGRASDHDMAQIVHATGVLHKAPLYLHDSSTTVNQIRSAARRLRAEAGDLGLVIVDHIQDMEGPGDNRREQIGGIARGLKALAKELNTGIIAVSQLSRIKGRSDHTPMLGDLKESGDVENSADTVWMLYRQEYYDGPKDKDGRDIRNQARLIVAKQRNGQTGVVPLTWLPSSVRFDNAARGGWNVAA
jgi:replicative DNA helicase